MIIIGTRQQGGTSDVLLVWPQMSRPALVTSGPVLVVMGTLDPDWADPHAEGLAIVDALPSGLGRLEMIEGARHYPHDQFPDQVVSLMLAFLRSDAARA